MRPVEQYCRCFVSGHLCGKADTQRWYKGGASTPLRSFTLGSLLLKDEVPVLDFHAYQQVGQQTSVTCVSNQHHSESFHFSAWLFLPWPVQTLNPNLEADLESHLSADHFN